MTAQEKVLYEIKLAVRSAVGEIRTDIQVFKEQYKLMKEQVDKNVIAITTNLLKSSTNKTHLFFQWAILSIILANTIGLTYFVIKYIFSK